MKYKIQPIDNYAVVINDKIKQEELKDKDFLLWKDKIHQFHSDIGYGWKTYTNMEKDGSSLCLNYSNVFGKVIATIAPYSIEGLPMLELPNPAYDWFASKSYLEQHSLSDKYFESRNPSLLTNEQVTEMYKLELPNQEEDVEKLFKDKYKSFRTGSFLKQIKEYFAVQLMMIGYKAAKKQYSEEDMINFSEFIEDWLNNNISSKSCWVKSEEKLDIDDITTKELLNIWKEQQIKTIYYE